MATSKDFKVISPRVFEFEVPASEVQASSLRPHIPVKQSKPRPKLPLPKPTPLPEPVEVIEPGFPNDPGADVVLSETSIKLPKELIRPLSAASRRNSKVTDVMRNKAVAAIEKYERQKKIWEKQTVATQNRKATVRKETPKEQEEEGNVVDLIAQYHEGKKLTSKQLTYLQTEARKHTELMAKRSQTEQSSVNVDLMHPWPQSQAESVAEVIPSPDSSFEELP